MSTNNVADITVLHLVTGLGIGGAERVVLELSGRLPAHGIRPIVVTLNADTRLLSQYKASVFPVHVLAMAKTPRSLLMAVLALRKIIRDEQVTIIHAHMFHALCAGLICAVLSRNVKLVFTSHNSKGFSLFRRIIITATKWFRHADIIFFAGQHARQNATSTVVISNGVGFDDRPIVTPTRNYKRKVFIAVGRLEIQKNPSELIRSFSKMRRKDCELWLVGDGPLRPEVEQEISSLGMAERIKLLGIRKDVSTLLKQADCFVMSSLWEGLPIALLEAGAAALPVIAPPVGAIPELLKDDCGFLVEVGDLHTAMDQVLDDYGEARRRGFRLREKIISGYSLENMVAAHAALYTRLNHES